MQPTSRQPLFLVSGASCVGKTTACELLFREERDYLVLGCDLVWNDYYNTPDDGYRTFRRLWMNLCANVSQIGKPCVLCGCCVPEQYEPLEERGLFSATHYLALVADDDALMSRMDRRGIDAGTRKAHLDFNRWLRENGPGTEPAMTLLDTTHLTPRQAAEKIDGWIRERL